VSVKRVADFGSLSRFGTATALVEDSGAEVSYAELAHQCEAFAGALGDGRQLVLLQAANDVGSVVAYLSALAAGHVVILTGDADDSSRARIVRDFSPNVICRRGEVTDITPVPPADLHPDLALLLPTSGSTGSPKLVRLSHRNLDSNAKAIVEYLQITQQDRAISSLPFHYSYGMSVLNSHLRAGSSVVLTDMSVTNPDFWRLFRETRATSIAGVPYSYELFERIGLRGDPPETLRVMTQAGGPLPKELAKAYAAFGAANGVRFYPMYGQTEAAPRMAYLPPDLALRNPDCIGVAIPGGALRLEDEHGAEISEAEVAGELVYRGPNVMMGYAHGVDDLSRGPDVDELRTGDLAARTPNGLFRIVGRTSRFVKIAGLRIGLDDIEEMLAESGFRVRAAGVDGHVFICAIGDDDDSAAAREFVAQRCRLPIASIVTFAVQEEPRLATGKVDYQAIRAMGEALAERTELGGEGGVIAAAYAKALGIALPPPEATFASLGGDSLSYVNASIGIERALGQTPLGWETMPIASLEAMARSSTPSGRAVLFRWSWISSEIVVRVVALSLVIAGHAVGDMGDGWWLRGGTNVLFAMAGFSLARFQGEALRNGAIGVPIAAATYRIVLPYAFCLGVILLLMPRELSRTSLALVSVFAVGRLDPLRAYWFIETLFHALLITCALFLASPVRRLAAARPFRFALLLIAGATVLMWAMPLVWSDGFATHYTIDAWLYTYYLGWGAYVARRHWQKALVVALAATIAGFQYHFPNFRELWLTAALAMVMFAPRLKAPSLVNSAILTLAAANYFIYLMHVFAFRALELHGGRIHDPLLRVGLLWVGSVAAGLGFAWAWNAVVPEALGRIMQLLAGFRARRLLAD
jgi:acyl-CoA synthetase (AMP-forming)/AMP-acid ligase II